GPSANPVATETSSSPTEDVSSASKPSPTSASAPTTSDNVISETVSFESSAQPTQPASKPEPSNPPPESEASVSSESTSAQDSPTPTPTPTPLPTQSHSLPQSRTSVHTVSTGTSIPFTSSRTTPAIKQPTQPPNTPAPSSPQQPSPTSRTKHTVVAVVTVVVNGSTGLSSETQVVDDSGSTYNSDDGRNDSGAMPFTSTIIENGSTVVITGDLNGAKPSSAARSASSISFKLALLLSAATMMLMS
ncbi:hypothetical protein GGH92_011029, partial [Coemansia sp. RSA 2673]